MTTEPDGTTVTIEGRVVGPWVDELHTCWRRQLASSSGPIRVELDGVTFIDDVGKAVLRAMHIDGAMLTANTVMMRAVIDAIVGRR
jgi:hypothetical protein